MNESNERGIIQLTVPMTGTYKITAKGASSGKDITGSSANVCGKGAVLPDVNLDYIKVKLLKWLLDKKGNDNTYGNASGGGGGTFVLRSPYSDTKSILMIAGGGGGYNGRTSANVAEANANLETKGQNSVGPVSGGENGYGGKAVGVSFGFNGGAGGGGFLTSGSNVITDQTLYSFSSHTFTNCGASGRNGPTLSQCRSQYASTGWQNTYLNMSTQGYQEWTVPTL